ncbi:hypothetical protein [Nakamurella sp.]|uniref:hypothetical protein n=1 Tax=Nakamurella sp. TaxID=1869182 RepID=UPI003B3AABB0
MPIAQKRAWAMMIASALAYVVYVVLVVTRLQDPVADTPYIAAMLWTIGGSVLATVLAEVGFAISTRREGRAALRTDERDREIDRFGDHVGQAFVVIGAIAALIMAMLQWPYFWIANAVYLAFVLSAVLGSAARLAAYRESFQPW